MTVSLDGFVAENFRQQNLNQSTRVRVLVKMGIFFKETKLKKGNMHLWGWKEMWLNVAKNVQTW